MYFLLFYVFFVLFYVLFVLWCSLYCLCVYVDCTTATGWLPNCSKIYHIIYLDLFCLPFRHKRGCDIYVVQGISLLKGFHFFANGRGFPLFHIALKPRTLRDLNKWKYKDRAAVKQTDHLEPETHMHSWSAVINKTWRWQQLHTKGTKWIFLPSSASLYMC